MGNEITKYYGIINKQGRVVETSKDLPMLESRLLLYPTWYQIQERHVFSDGRLGKVIVIRKSDQNIRDEIAYDLETKRQIKANQKLLAQY